MTLKVSTDLCTKLLKFYFAHVLGLEGYRKSNFFFFFF